MQHVHIKDFLQRTYAKHARMLMHMHPHIQNTCMYDSFAFIECPHVFHVRAFRMSATLMLNMINPTINKYNQSIKQTNQINQNNTRQSIQSVKQSHQTINAVCVCGMFLMNVLCACACACTHHAFVHACMYICMCVKHHGYMQSTNTCMCLSGVH